MPVVKVRNSTRRWVASPRYHWKFSRPSTGSLKARHTITTNGRANTPRIKTIAGNSSARLLRRSEGLPEGAVRLAGGAPPERTCTIDMTDQPQPASQSVYAVIMASWFSAHQGRSIGKRSASRSGEVVR
ncbi:hypothetical protein MMUR_34020 [Mycolicibacterium murale]|uniref:Uncharacterized protein n=1 Tax=Mycolicibacterium murale TaxID=182220 RepID=A0A7I9WPR7_9MYCO|nr:hypothetical protein MMUR_34020 [Mycolicibacterium murale]